MYYITERDVTENLGMKETIGAMREAFRDYSSGEADTRPRERIILNGIVYNTMPAILPKYGLAGLKTYIASKNGARFVVVLFDTQSMDLIAVMEANRLGQVRTGALPAMVTSNIVKEKDIPVCIIGSGFQAETQLEGLLAVYDPSDIRVYSRNHRNAAAFAQRMSSKTGRDIRAFERARDATMGARVINTITDSNDPIFERSDLSDTYHVNLCGGNIPTRHEVGTSVLADSQLIIAENLQQALRESGEIIDFMKEYPDREVIELKDFIRQAVKAPQRTVFKSMGIGLEDVAAAHVVLKNMGIRH